MLKDFAAHLSRTGGDAAAHLTRAFRDAAEAFAAPGRLSTIVLTGAAVELPPEVEAVAVRYRLASPGPQEYRATVLAVMRSLEEGGRAAVELRSEDVDELAGALQGMTLNQARQAVAHAALDDGRLGRTTCTGSWSARPAPCTTRGCSSTSRQPRTRHSLEASPGWVAGWTARAPVSRPAPPSWASSHPVGLLIVGGPGVRQVAGLQDDRPRVGAAAAQARRRSPIRQVHRRVGAQSPPRWRSRWRRPCSGSTRALRACALAGDCGRRSAGPPSSLAGRAWR